MLCTILLLPARNQVIHLNELLELVVEENWYSSIIVKINGSYLCFSGIVSLICDKSMVWHVEWAFSSFGVSSLLGPILDILVGKVKVYFIPVRRLAFTSFTVLYCL